MRGRPADSAALGIARYLVSYAKGILPVRYRDALSEEMVKARYLAERHEIAARYAEWDIAGPTRFAPIQTRVAVGPFLSG